MGKHPVDIKLIFGEALEKKTAGERSAYLDKVCGNNADLRNKIEALLKAYEEADDVPEAPIIGSEITLDSAPLTEGPGTKIGRYKLLQRIGEGGFGVVYMAEQESPVRRRVALKIIKLGMDTKQVIARFEAERQALAMMEHPNIAKVLDGGATETGRPYFVMELVKGMPITEYCDQNNLHTQERLELFADVCKAIQHAHQKGIIHRDIKPSNVMITLHDGKPVPKVIDFGIAKATQQRLTEKTLFTEYQQFIGTPEYMSPEQAEMSGLDIDTRSDIYSLGVLLYELLTGTTPFEAEKLRSAAYDEIRRIIREDEPPKPSTRLSTLGETLAEIARHRHVQPSELRRIIRGDLDWIVMKSLEKDRTRRYETANDLAQDIYRHLSDEPVLAGPPDTVYRVRKFFRRNRTLVTGAGIVLLVLLAGIVVSTIFAIGQSHARKQEAAARIEAVTAQNQAEQAREKEAVARTEAVAARDKAQEAESVAQQHRRQAQRLLAESQIDRGVRLLNEGDCLGLLDLLEARITADAIPDLKDQASRLWAIAYDLSSDRLVQVFGDGGGHQLVFSPDGKLLATAEGNTAQLWDTATGQPHGPVLHLERFIDVIALSPDGKLLATHSLAGVSRLWHTATGKPAGPVLQTNGSLDRSAAREYHSANVRWSAAFSPEGKLLATASLDGTVGLWETKTGQPYVQPIQHESQVWTVAFSPDGKLLASGSEDGSVRLWEVASIKPYGSVLQHNNPIRKVAFSPEGTLVATMTWGGAFIQLWETRTGQLQKQLLHEVPGWTTDLSFSPDGKLLAASEGWMARLWDTQTGEEGQSLYHEAPVASVAFSPEDRLFATGSRDWTTRLWDLSKNRSYGQPLHHRGTVDKVVFSPDGQYLATRSWPGTARLWRAFQPLRTEVVPWQVGHKSLSDYDENSPVTVRMMSDGGIGAIISRGTVRLWDPKTFRAMGKPLRHDDRVRVVAFSPDKRLLAVGLFGETVRLWEVATGRHFGPPLEVKNAETIAFSPDGKLLAVGSAAWRAMVFSTDTGRLLHNLGSEGGIESAAFNKDGTVLATASATGVVQLWDMDRGRQIASLIQPGAGVWAVRFSPDGNILAAASGEEDRAVRLWDLSVGPPYHSLDFPAQAVGGNRALEAFNTDGTIMVRMLPGAGARVWRVPQTPTDLREMQLKTWLALGLRRNQQGAVTAVQAGRWQSLRHELALNEQAHELQLVDMSDSPISIDLKLAWTPGKDAVAHDVYFGTDPHELKYLGRARETAYDNLPELDTDTKYCWRIDTVESDGSVRRGNLWTSRTSKLELVGWWKLDGNVTDSAGSGYDGELVNGGQWVKGKTGGALRFDGEDDFVSLPIGSLISTLDRATIMLWVDFSNEGGPWQRIFDFGTGTTSYTFLTPRLWIDGPMRFGITTAGMGYPEQLATAPLTLPSGWRHVAATIEPGYMRLFLDGELIEASVGALTFSDLGVTTNNWLGRSQYPADAFFKGSMDDLRIYNYAMSQAEVAAIYAGREQELPDNPQWFFKVERNELAPPEPEPGRDDRYYVPLEAEKAPREPELLSIEELKVLCSVLKSSEQSVGDFYTCALAYLGMGETEGYRNGYAEILDHFGQTEDAVTAHWVAWTCALAADAVEDFNNVIELAELMIEKGGETDQNLNTLGAVLYRAGRFDEAVGKLTELSNRWDQTGQYPTLTSPAYTWFFLAMAHHQLGDADQSQKYFDLAVKRSEEETARDVPWNRRLTLQLLRKESAKLLGVPQ